MRPSSSSWWLAGIALTVPVAMIGCAPGPGEQGPVRALAATDAGTAAALAPDELLAVTLDARLSTGFAWQVDEVDASVLRLVGREHRPSTLLGGMDQEILRFAGVTQGRTSLGLFYRRPWDPPRTGEQVYRVDIEVAGPYGGPPYQPPAAVAAAQVLASEVSESAIPTRYNVCESSAGTYARCTPVKDQGTCGSCWAFATAGVFENVIHLDDPSRVPDLSEQYLVSCNTEGWSCEGGYAALQYYVDQKKTPPELDAGAVYEADFPYTARSAACGSSPHPHHEKALRWAWAVTGTATAAERVALIQRAILDHGPVWTDVCADTAFQDWTPARGVFAGTGCTDVNHGVVLVGWDDNDGHGYWIVRNSWGSRWGDQGYLRVYWGANAIASNAAYAVYDGGNQRPLANAGAAQTVEQGAAVALDGSASADADGSIQTYAWAQTSGPAVTLAGSDTARPTFTAPAVSASAVLAFRLTVEDDRGAESSAGTAVTIRNPDAPESPESPASPETPASRSPGVKAGCGTGGSAAATAWSVLLLMVVAWRRRRRS